MHIPNVYTDYENSPTYIPNVYSCCPMYIMCPNVYTLGYFKVHAYTLGNMYHHTPQCIYCHPMYIGGRLKWCPMYIPNVYLCYRMYILNVYLLYIHWGYTLGYIDIRWVYTFQYMNIRWVTFFPIYIGYIHWSVFIYIGVFSLVWGFIDVLSLFLL